MAIFSHLHSVPVLERFLSEYCHKVWRGNTRMVCPTDGEKLTKIYLFVSAEYTNVTDTRTDRQTHGQRPHGEVAKRKFYSSFNGIFGKIGRVASECIPCLLYASEALPFNSSQLKSLGFPPKRILFKMFKTDIVSQCQELFNFSDVLELIFRRKRKIQQQIYHNGKLIM